MTRDNLSQAGATILTMAPGPGIWYHGACQK